MNRRKSDNLQNMIDDIIDKATPWEIKLELADSIAEKYGAKATMQLCGLLESDDGEVRNAAALALRDIKDSAAIEPLMRAIHNPQNSQDRSTLVYALSAMDCSAYFSEIVTLTLSPRPDVCGAACDVFFDQGFYVTNEVVQQAIERVTGAKIEHDLKDGLLRRLAEFDEP